MEVIGIIGCALGFAVVIFLAYKNFSPFITSVIGSLLVIVMNGMPLASTLTEIYIPKVVSFAGSYYLVFLFGAILARIYANSGAAISIAEGIMRLFFRKNSEKASEQKKQILALTACMLIPAIMGLGGIITSIVMIICYPVALAIFEKANIPKRFSYCALALGAFTWVCTIPFTPQVTNIIPQQFLGTTSSSGLIPGLIGGVVHAVLAIVILNIMVNKAKKNGEVFAYGSTDIKYESDSKKPNVFLALVPLVVMFVIFNVFSGLGINICLLITVVLSLILFWKQLKNIGVLKTCNEGAAASLAPMFGVGAMVGFANIVTSTNAFGIITNAIFSLDVSPIILVFIVCGIIAALTGGSGTGFLVSLPILVPALVEGKGVDPEMIHRVGLFAGNATALLPYSGCVMLFLPVSGLKVKELYKPVLFTCVLLGLAVAALVALLFAIGL